MRLVIIGNGMAGAWALGAADTADAKPAIKQG